MKTTGTIPTSSDLLKTLIDLYADQEGIKVDYTIERNNDERINKEECS